MESAEIRRKFIRFFADRGHKVLPSSSLIPDDPTLLLTNAGMNQFKPYFLGLQEPPYPRATTVQKVFRTSDIENVGRTDRHATFFEMMGNFSFGDYFKLDACKFGYELVTEVYGLDPERMWVTVYEPDDESIDIWADEVGIPRERIVRRGKADNFWSMHVAGPAGPCSEIFIDRGPNYGQEGGPAVDEDRYLEIWNLVFMQHAVDDEENILSDLPKKSIDTGSGLERVALVLQDAGNIFEADVLRPLVEVAERLTGHRYGADDRDDVSLRVLAEHGRATTFLMADGVLPSNEGRGYVLRRMLRRLVTHARRLGVEKPVMGGFIAGTVERMGEAYPELVANRAFVESIASGEEERFGATYRAGMTLFEQEVAKAKEKGSNVLTGNAAFRLHDTFGFQVQLTSELAEEEGLTVDDETFARLMQEQRQRGKDALKRGDHAGGVVGQIAAEAGPTEFLGYEHLSAEATVTGVVAEGARAEVASEGESVILVLDRTPFYAEGGGQVGDAGTIRTPGGVVQVTDTRPGPGGTTIHEGRVTAGEVRPGQEATAEVDAERRASTARSHTSTHILHHTVRRLLGEHARQAGSLVAPGRLRFDFSHFEAVPKDVLEEVEVIANARLAEDRPVIAYETTQEYARTQGAMALFGEKYGDIVRVVEVGDYSVELCGGTHVRRTGEIALVRVLGEGSIGSGIRRLEALTGPDALKHVNVERRLLEEVVEALGGGDPQTAPERIRQAIARIKQMESERGKIAKAERGREVERLAATAQEVDGVSLVVANLPGQDADAIREMALGLRARMEKLGPGAAVLGTATGERVLLVASCTNDLIARGIPAPALLERAAREIGGGAGGKPVVAFAGGSKVAALDDALRGIPRRLEELLGA